jgi:hypothetical protein
MLGITCAIRYYRWVLIRRHEGTRGLRENLKIEGAVWSKLYVLRLKGNTSPPVGWGTIDFDPSRSRVGILMAHCLENQKP